MTGVKKEFVFYDDFNNYYNCILVDKNFNHAASILSTSSSGFGFGFGFGCSIVLTIAVAYVVMNYSDKIVKYWHSIIYGDSSSGRPSQNVQNPPVQNPPLFQQQTVPQQSPLSLFQQQPPVVPQQSPPPLFQQQPPPALKKPPPLFQQQAKKRVHNDDDYNNPYHYFKSPARRESKPSHKTHDISEAEQLRLIQGLIDGFTVEDHLVDISAGGPPPPTLSRINIAGGESDAAHPRRINIAGGESDAAHPRRINIAGGESDAAHPRRISFL